MGIRFGELELDVDAVELRYGGDVVPLELQVFKVLAHLVEHRERVVPKEELLDEIWGDRFVSESALTSRIKTARRAVLDDGRTQAVIRTVHGVGYRFVAVVDETPIPAIDDGAEERFAALLFTDIEGSSAAWERDGADMAERLAHHDELLTAAIEEQGGTVFKHLGDGLCSVFHSAASAVTAAIVGQRSLQQAHWPDGERPLVRMGVHAGTVLTRAGDFFGPTVNRASRIAGVANGDQIVASRPAADLAAGEVGGGVTFADAGWVQLIEGAPASPLMLVGSTEVATTERPLRGQRAIGRPITRPVKAILGRDDELRELGELLIERRMVSLIGPGGVGKTHLASHAAFAAIAAGASQGWFCQLADVRDPHALGDAVLAAVGGAEQPDTTAIESVVRVMEARTGVLLLDNCEHVRNAAAGLCRQLLARATGVTILATTRQRLNVIGDHAMAVGPLADGPAAALFAEHAASLGVRIDVNDAALQKVCERLDRLPLALELAAARMPHLSIADLERLLDDRFALLAAEGDGPDHHLTLEAAIAWSYDALEPGHQWTLDALSVFAGPFDLNAATAVADDTATESGVPARVLDLCEASLVVAEPATSGRHNYRLLESTKAFGEPRLVDRDRVRQRHVRHHVELVESAYLMAERGDIDRSLAWIREIWDNIRAAVDYAEEADDRLAMLRIIGAIGPYTELTQSFEVLNWCERALGDRQRAEPGPELREALATWSRLLSYRNAFAEAEALAEEATALGRSPGVQLARFWAAWTVGRLDAAQIELDVMDELTAGTGGVSEASVLTLQHFLAWVRGVGCDDASNRLATVADNGGETAAIMYLLARALVELPRTDAGDAIADLDEIRVRSERLGLWLLSGGAATAATTVHVFDPDRERAASRLAESMRHYVASGTWTMIASDLPMVAIVLTERGHAAEAARILGAADEFGFRGGVSEEVRTTAADRAAEALRADEFEACIAAGRAMSPLDAAHLAIATLEASSEPTAPTTST